MRRFLLSAVLFILPGGFLFAGPEADLVEIASVDPTIQIELKYATADNLTGRVLYPPDFKARLRRATALQLKSAQDALRAHGYGLKVWDAYRPIEAQEALFAIISDPRFVATPGVQSMHNRGVAVDVTLVDSEGREVTMPTKYDEMSHKASFFYDGKDPVLGRKLALLQKVMSQNGFYACKTEWWHFFSRNWREYPNVTSPAKKQILKEGLSRRSAAETNE